MKSHYVFFLAGVLFALISGSLGDTQFIGQSISCAVVSFACFVAAFAARVCRDM